MSQARPLGALTALLCGLGVLHVAAVLAFVSTSTLPA